MQPCLLVPVLPRLHGAQAPQSPGSAEPRICGAQYLQSPGSAEPRIRGARAILAPTGMATYHINGNTIHSMILANEHRSLGPIFLKLTF